MDDSIFKEIISLGGNVHPVLAILLIAIGVAVALYLGFRKKKTKFQERKEAIARTGKDQKTVNFVKAKIKAFFQRKK